MTDDRPPLPPRPESSDTVARPRGRRWASGEDSASRGGQAGGGGAALPARIGSYDIRGELGRGGMGVVYEAVDIRLGRAVALKALPSELSRDAEAMARLEREARACAAINHPNVATLYGLEEHQGRRFLVLELVEGPTLAQRIDAGDLPLAAALSCCAQVAAGVGAAHEAGVVHRDLKPANVKLSARGVAKVLDFGLSHRRARSGEGDSSDPDAAAVVGTPGFMSPEQIEGGLLDERTDAWSFGCLLYECLAGRSAFPGANSEARFEATLGGPPPLEALPVSVPAAVRELLAACLVRDRESRLRDLDHAERVLSEAAAELADASRRSSSSARARRRGNLPAAVSTFVGREAEVAEVAQLLGTHRLVTLTGAGGVGKTRLAVQVARTLSPYPAGGCWLVELAAVGDPALVARQAAHAFSLPEAPGVTPTEALGRHLGDQNVLLILDNCEHVLGACASLARELLAECPGLRMLATSREGLGVAGERVFSVPTLALPEADATPEAAARSEAVRLFVERARLLVPEFRLDEDTAAHVARACRRLDGIPLGIELAAARVRHLTAEQIDRRLGDRFKLLTGGSRSALPRHQTLRAAIDWSHELLAPAEQVLLRRLAVFRGGWTVEMAESVASGDGVDEGDVLDLLGHLADKSLVQVDSRANPPRHAFLETVREYAGEKLLGSGEAATVRLRHRATVQALLDAPTREPSSGSLAGWLARIAREHENVAEAVERALDDPEGTRDALRLVTGALRYWLIHGHWRAGRQHARAALAKAGAAEPELRMRLLPGVASIEWKLGEVAAARALSEEVLALGRKLGDKRTVAATLRELGLLAADENDLPAARDLHEQALALFRETDDAAGTASALRALSVTVQLQGDAAASRMLLEESLEVCRRLGDRIGVATSLNNLGCVLREAGFFEEAREPLRETVQISEELGHRDLLATALNNLGMLEVDRGDLAVAQGLLDRSLTMRRELGDKRFCASSLLALARLALASGKADTGARLLGASAGIHARLGTVTDLRLDWDAAVAQARAALGETAYDSAFAAGGRLTIDEAAACARMLGESTASS